MTALFLPPYMYQMIDHLYLSDLRGFVYHDFFDVIINTSSLRYGNSGSITKYTLSKKTIQVLVNVQPITTQNVLEDLCNELLQATVVHKKILLYSDSYDTSAKVIYTYLTTRYHFTKEDITRMLLTRPYSNGLLSAFRTIMK